MELSDTTGGLVFSADMGAFKSFKKAILPEEELEALENFLPKIIKAITIKRVKEYFFAKFIYTFVY